MMHHYGYWGHPGLHALGWWWLGLHALAWVLVGALLICLYRRYRKNQASQAPPTAMDILKKRYAQGEITQEEFNTRKENLK